MSLQVSNAIGCELVPDAGPMHLQTMRTGLQPSGPQTSAHMGSDCQLNELKTWRAQQPCSALPIGLPDEARDEPDVPDCCCPPAGFLLLL